MRQIVRWSVVVVALSCVCSFLAAQDTPPLHRVAQIRATPGQYINEHIYLEGYVTQFVEQGSRSTAFFYLKDDWGGLIKVRTSKDRPSVGKRYFISGPLGVDPKTKDLYISEESRIERFKPEEAVITMEQETIVSPPKPATDVIQANAVTSLTKPEVALPVAPSPARTDEPSTRNRMLYAALGGGAFAALAVAAAMILRNRKEEVGTGDFTLASAIRTEPPPAPEQILEGRTIKLHAPPPNTVKMMPGWFEVVAGDDVVKQIRFYKIGDNGDETTFGRVAGRPYVHVQLKAPTVSSRQAKVAFDGPTAKLTNFASPDSNPTKVNGRELAMNETVVLNENDRVEMGEVSLLFHEAATARPLVT